jgi:hypothetical protein
MAAGMPQCARGGRGVTESCPNGALPEFAFPDCSMKTQTPALHILVDDKRVLICIVGDLTTPFSR